MKHVAPEYEYVKVKVDRIADARGIIFSKKIQFIENALQSLQQDQILKIFCSDEKHKDEIPKWIEAHGHTFLAIIDERNYFKILIQKGK